MKNNKKDKNKETKKFVFPWGVLIFAGVILIAMIVIAIIYACL